MKERLKEHGRRSLGHTSATFAFIMAKKKAKRSGEIDLSQKREALERDPKFKPIYDQMKERILKMQIKVVKIQNPVEQTFFEVYAALELKTPHNEWRNH